MTIAAGLDLRPSDSPVSNPASAYINNLGRGVGERAAKLAGGGVRFVGQSADELTDWLGQYIPMGQDPHGESPLLPLARRLENTSLGYVPGTSWEDVKAAPLSSILSYALEQGIISLPDAIAARISFPAYVSARMGEIGQKRAENDARSNATFGDFLAGAPAAVSAALLERLGPKSLFGHEVPVRSLGAVPEAVGKATVRDATAEGWQELLAYLGETWGTKNGVDWKEALDRVAAVAAGLGPFGGGKRIISGTTQALMPRSSARPAETPPSTETARPTETAPSTETPPSTETARPAETPAETPADVSRPIPTDPVPERPASAPPPPKPVAEPPAQTVAEPPAQTVAEPPAQTVARHDARPAPETNTASPNTAPLEPAAPDHSNLVPSAENTAVSVPAAPEPLSAPLPKQSTDPSQPRPSTAPSAADGRPAPILRRNGTPFATAKSAALSARQRPDLKGRPLMAVPVDGGWGLVADTAKGEGPANAQVSHSAATAPIPNGGKPFETAASADRTVPESVPATPVTDAAPPLSQTANPEPAGRPGLSARAQATADTLSRFDEAAGSPVAAWKGAATGAREIRAKELDAYTPLTVRQRGGGYGYAYRRGWDDAIAGRDLPDFGTIASTRYREGWQAARRWAGENPRPEGEGR